MACEEELKDIHAADEESLVSKDRAIGKVLAAFHIEAEGKLNRYELLRYNLLRAGQFLFFGLLCGCLAVFIAQVYVGTSARISGDTTLAGQACALLVVTMIFCNAATETWFMHSGIGDVRSVLGTFVLKSMFVAISLPFTMHVAMRLVPSWNVAVVGAALVTKFAAWGLIDIAMFVQVSHADAASEQPPQSATDQSSYQRKGCMAIAKGVAGIAVQAWAWGHFIGVHFMTVVGSMVVFPNLLAALPDSARTLLSIVIPIMVRAFHTRTAKALVDAAGNEWTLEMHCTTIIQHELLLEFVSKQLAFSNRSMADILIVFSGQMILEIVYALGKALIIPIQVQYEGYVELHLGDGGDASPEDEKLRLIKEKQLVNALTMDVRNCMEYFAIAGVVIAQFMSKEGLSGHALFVAFIIGVLSEMATDKLISQVAYTVGIPGLGKVKMPWMPAAYAFFMAAEFAVMCSIKPFFTMNFGFATQAQFAMDFPVFNISYHGSLEGRVPTMHFSASPDSFVLTHFWVG